MGTDDDPETIAVLKAELLALEYPWPEYLEGKSRAWLEAEIRALKPPDNKEAE